MTSPGRACPIIESSQACRTRGKIVGIVDVSISRLNPTNGRWSDRFKLGEFRRFKVLNNGENVFGKLLIGDETSTCRRAMCWM
jgi:hypothetical protein